MQIARVTENWDRYRYALDRGHRQYQQSARTCERMYLGGGRQWSDEDLAILKEEGRPAYEFNAILPSVNAAIGYQIQNRMDISFRPRGGEADQQQADIRSKIVMQIADQNRLHWHETQVFSDGLIQQRGYYDVRVKFNRNFLGDVSVTTLDPLDVVPDPDAKTYETDGWTDVLVTRWLTLDEIEQTYGKEARKMAESRQYLGENDFGDFDDSGEPRNKFAGPQHTGAAWDVRWLDGKIERLRIVERQRWVNTISRCLFFPATGDLKLAENLTPEVLSEQLERGAVPTKSMQRRVKWTVATSMDVLHDEWSPYDEFTVVPYFAYFRRGETIGMIDNAIGPQQARNKGLSQFLHVLNTSANSGWVVEQASLTNMTAQELEEKGSSTGLVLEVKQGSKSPEKIQPNRVPDGVDRIVQIASDALKDVTIPEAMRGITGPEKSGIAIQHKQFAAQQQLAMPLDNLSRTRHILGEKILKLIQQFYTEERVFRITGTDLNTGRPKEERIVVNQMTPEGQYVNDLTEGDYDVVVTEQPMQVTFDNSQFQQALELRQAGVMIPDTVMVQHSTLSRKADIVQEMKANRQADPVDEAKAELIKAQAVRTLQEAVNKAVESIFSATQAGNQIASMPAVAPLADQILRSAGFEDKDAPPIVPEAPQLPAGQLPELVKNTHPLEPANPEVGMKQGIEKADTGIGQPQ